MHVNKKWKEIREIHQMGFRLLKTVMELDRNLIPRSFLQAFLEAILPFVSIIMSAVLIDLLIGKNFKIAAITALVMIGITKMGELCIAFLDRSNQIGKATILDRLQVLVCQHAMELDYVTMQNPKTKEIIENTDSMARYNGGLDRIVSCYADLLHYMLSLIVACVLVIQMTFSVGNSQTGWLKIATHPVATLCFIVIVWVLATIFARKKATKIREMNNHIQDNHYKVEGQINYWLGKVLMNVNIGKTVRMNQMASTLMFHIQEWNVKARKLFEEMGLVSRKKLIVDGEVNGSFSIAAYVIVIFKVLANCITVGAFMKYTGALLQLNTATGKIGWTENEIARFGRDLKPFLDFMEKENTMKTGSIHVEKRLDHEYQIEFCDVSFRYPGSTQDVLKNVNCKITMKHKMAVVGLNGAGKTTFIKLLCRLYDPTEGKIMLNGIDIRKYSYEEYQKIFSVVFQDFHIFPFPLGENIAVSELYDEERVKDCLRKAGAFEMAMELTEGLSTNVDKRINKGVNLSGGQEQKVAIARALYKDAPFVILDEPTAALDPISEAEIYQRFDQMVEDKTSIYISHRMSSCRFCDEILVFEDGRIEERGTHEQLVQQKGLYSQMWNAQAQYYTKAVS